MHIPTDATKPLTLNELLLLHDEPFVRAAYQTLLGRPVDDSGLRNYLGQIRSGLAKEGVIAELAGSPEGRARGLDLPGVQLLLAAHERQQRCRLCRFIRTLLADAVAPIVQQLRIIDNRLYRLEQAIQGAGAQALVGGATPNANGDGAATSRPKLARPVNLEGRTVGEAFDEIAQRLLQSREAEVFRRGRTAPAETRA